MSLRNTDTSALPVGRSYKQQQSLDRPQMLNLPPPTSTLVQRQHQRTPLSPSPLQSPLRSVSNAESPIGSYFPPAHTLIDSTRLAKSSTPEFASSPTSLSTGQVNSARPRSSATTPVRQSNSIQTRSSSPSTPSSRSSIPHSPSFLQTETSLTNPRQVKNSLTMFDTERPPSPLTRPCSENIDGFSLPASSNFSSTVLALNKRSKLPANQKHSRHLNHPHANQSARTYHQYLAQQQKNYLVQQKELIHQANKSASQSGNPLSPRLLPLGSPGPVTPLTLEENQSGYLFAGSISNSPSQLQRQLENLSKSTSIPTEDELNLAE